MPVDTNNKSAKDELIKKNLECEYDECREEMMFEFRRKNTADNRLTLCAVPILFCIAGFPFAVRNLMGLGIGTAAFACVAALAVLFVLMSMTSLALIIKGLSYKNTFARNTYCFVKPNVYEDPEFFIHSIDMMNKVIKSLTELTEEKHKVFKAISWIVFSSIAAFTALALAPLFF